MVGKLVQTNSGAFLINKRTLELICRRNLFQRSESKVGKCRPGERGTWSTEKASATFVRMLLVLLLSECFLFHFCPNAFCSTFVRLLFVLLLSDCILFYFCPNAFCSTFVRMHFVLLLSECILFYLCPTSFCSTFVRLHFVLLLSDCFLFYFCPTAFCSTFVRIHFVLLMSDCILFDNGCVARHRSQAIFSYNAP
jgi:hypothetical protein